MNSHSYQNEPFGENSDVFDQKQNYMHNNPAKACLCNLPEEYVYSSADYYELNKSKWDFIANYDE